MLGLAARPLDALLEEKADNHPLLTHWRRDGKTPHATTESETLAAA
jgi:hypothetical protein